MYDVRLRLSNQVVEEVKSHFQDLVFDTIIQRNTKLSEAPSFGVSVIMHEAGSRGAANYLSLAREIVRNNTERREVAGEERSEEHTSELQSLMRIPYADFCLKNKKETKT